MENDQFVHQFSQVLREGLASWDLFYMVWLRRVAPQGRASAHDYMYVCASDRATGQCVVTQAAPNQPQDAVVPLMYPVRWPGRNPGYIHGTDSSGIIARIIFANARF